MWESDLAAVQQRRRAVTGHRGRLRAHTSGSRRPALAAELKAAKKEGREEQRLTGKEIALWNKAENRLHPIKAVMLATPGSSAMRVVVALGGRRASPEAPPASGFAAGSTGPKVEAACRFVTETGGLAATGSITEAAALAHGEAGTVVGLDAAGLELAGVC